MSADPNATTPSTTTPATGGDPAQPGGEGTTQGKDPKALANEVGYLTRKLQEAEKKAADFERAEADRKKAELSETERLKAEKAEADARAAAAEQRAKDTLLRTRFELAATKAGAVDSEAAYKLADLSQVTVGEDGTVQGLDAAVEALKTSRAFLFGTTKPGAVGSGGGNPGGDTSGAKKYDADAIKRMSAQEFAKFQADVAAGLIKI